MTENGSVTLEAIRDNDTTPENEAIRVHVVSLDGDMVRLEVRIRGNDNWIYIRESIKPGDAIIILDNQPRESNETSG